MAKITKIEPQKKREGRFNLFLDDQFAIGVSEEVIIALGLKEGLEIDPKKLKGLEKAEEESKAYGRALHFLSYRPRSEKEVSERLKRKFEEKLVKATISRLKKEKLLDDREFAKAWLLNRKLLRPKGRRLLFLELKQKGVSEEIIKKILEKDYNKDEEIKKAEEVAEKKTTLYQNLSKEEFHQKIVGFLSRRGFSWDVIKEVLEKL